MEMLALKAVAYVLYAVGIALLCVVLAFLYVKAEDL